jgi:hypothetical protein
MVSTLHKIRYTETQGSALTEGMEVRFSGCVALQTHHPEFIEGSKGRIFNLNLSPRQAVL